LTMVNISFDTMIAAYLIEPGTRRYNLGALAEQWLNVATIPIESLIGKGKTGKNFSQTAVTDAAHYSGEDAVIPLYLKDIFEPILSERNLLPLFNDVEMPLVSVLAEMEWCGVIIDTELLKRLSLEYSLKLDGISGDIY